MLQPRNEVLIHNAARKTFLINQYNRAVKINKQWTRHAYTMSTPKSEADQT